MKKRLEVGQAVEIFCGVRFYRNGVVRKVGRKWAKVYSPNPGMYRARAGNGEHILLPLPDSVFKFDAISNEPAPGRRGLRLVFPGSE